MGVVMRIPDGVIKPFPTRRGRGVGLAGDQVHAGGQDMQVGTAFLVAHRRPGQPVGIRLIAELGEHSGLKILQDGGYLLIGRRILRRPGHHCALVSVLEIEAIRDFCNSLRIAAQHLDPLALDALCITRSDNVVGGSLGSTGAMAKPLNVHPRLPRSRQNRQSRRGDPLRASMHQSDRIADGR